MTSGYCYAGLFRFGGVSVGESSRFFERELTLALGETDRSVFFFTAIDFFYVGAAGTTYFFLELILPL
jgi:hypothetical protein